MRTLVFLWTKKLCNTMDYVYRLYLFLRNYRSKKWISSHVGDVIIARPKVNNITSLSPKDSDEPKLEVECDRILTVGFDDLRLSDILWVEPLFEKFGYKATFDKILYGKETYFELHSVRKLANHGHEIGNHTLLHYGYPFFSPLFNGQDPSCPDGSGQYPFPTNDDFRKDVGGGFNAFGKKLNEKVVAGVNGPNIDVSWGELTDEQCQQIRDHFSVIKDPVLGSLLDVLSNRFLGTKGRSFGSWCSDKQCYTGGVFSGCRTSENHEIWERILQIETILFLELGVQQKQLKTWSWPGSRNCFLTFHKNGVRYYDRARTKPFNNLSRFYSSLTRSERSFTEVLRSCGYCSTNDTLYAGRYDGLEIVEQRNLFFNSFLSKEDGLEYSTKNVVSQYDCKKSCGLKQYVSEVDSYCLDRKNKNGIYTSLEKLRHSLASGIIAGSVWDSTFDPTEKRFWRIILRYCNQTNVSVITMKDAYEKAFCQNRELGNLIYNPCFSHTLKDFLPNTEVPPNPDGWIGPCVCNDKAAEKILSIHGIVTNKNYGLPLGSLLYSVESRGHGKIHYRLIRNKAVVDSDWDEKEQFEIADVKQQGWCNYKVLINNTIPPPIMDKSGRFEGRKDVVIAIEFRYEGDLEIKNLSLIKELS